MSISTIGVRRMAGVFVASVATVASTVLATPGSALAASAFIDRGRCRWHAESYTYEADTERVGGTCAGHAWLQIKAGGAWGGWVHDDRWAHLYAPTGKPIQQSRHKSCADCSYITLTP